MEGLNVNPLLDVSNAINANKKVTRANAPDEFLKVLCEEWVDQMLPSSTKIPSLAKKIYAEKLAQQMIEKGVMEK